MASYKNCVACGTQYRRRKESIAQWRDRKFCSRPCSNKAAREFDERAALLAKVERQPNGCWNWTGATKRPGGHGHTGKGGAHRRAYMLFVGPIPTGKYVLHRCDNPLCINPEHLWTGSQADNIADMQAKGRGWWQTWARPQPEELGG